MGDVVFTRAEKLAAPPVPQGQIALQAGLHAVTITYFQAYGPMALDIAAIQAIYGANTTYASGNTVYTLPTTNGIGTGWKSIWDTGGVDTISGAGATGVGSTEPATDAGVGSAGACVGTLSGGRSVGHGSKR